MFPVPFIRHVFITITALNDSELTNLGLVVLFLLLVYNGRAIVVGADHREIIAMSEMIFENTKLYSSTTASLGIVTRNL